MEKEKAIKQLEAALAKALYSIKGVYPDFDPTDAHNIDTPRRIAKMWVEMFKGLELMDFQFTKFINEDCKSGNWIILKDIEFSSMCQHHFLPFSGVVHIGYVPKNHICGISKLARVVDYFSQRPQVQERLGKDILDFLYSELKPYKLAIIIESKHSCVGCRGIKSRNASMITTHSRDIADLREFKELIN